ncbi:MAG: hypothetical protein IJC83_06310, partial [Oscillospiraceae bacterium]|nr:hypothetical protein [Oscillospiraceae bacterium]
GSITLKCSRCSETKKETIAGSSSYCTNSSHSGKVTSTTTAATCTTDGSIVYKCSKCIFTYTITLPATGHNFVDGVCSSCGATS